MVSVVVRTPKLTDGEILTLIAELIEIAPEGSADVQYPVGESVDISLKHNLTDEQLGDNRRLIERFTFSFGGTVREIVGYHRGIVDPETWRQHPNRNGFHHTLPSAYFDELGFLEPERVYGQQAQYDQLDKETIFSVASLVQAKAVEGTLVGQSEPAGIADLVMGQLHELRVLHLEMTKGLADARLAADKQLAQRTKKIEEEYSARTSHLTELESQLETRRQELNDREPQHERRRLREHLTSHLRATVAEPRLDTIRRERTSNYLYLTVALVFIAISAALAITTDFNTNTVTAAFWARTAKSLASGIVGAGFAWAGLSGLKTSAVAARDYEQAIQRYAFDMDRASWVVETILQMNAAEQADVPEEWLEAVCRDLFASATPRDKQSFEGLAALFDATAKARIGTHGVEFEIDRKAAKRLASD